MSTAALLRDDGHPVGDVYLTRGELASRVGELGWELAKAYAGREPVLVAALKSSAVFLADLSRAFAISHELDVLQLSGYDGTQTRGGARLLKDLDRPIAGRDVILVEDVVDTGLTLGFLARTLRERSPASLTAVTLLDRPHRRLVHDVPLAWTGFTVPDELFCGYGLGLDERWRSLPDLHLVVSDELPVAI